MMFTQRLAGLIAVFAVILALKLLSFKPIWNFHGSSRNSLEGNAGAYPSSNTLVWGRVHPLEDKSTEVILKKDSKVYAPIIIAAGQGTTGTHLFAEVTCQLGFVSLHFAVGCLPSNAISAKQPKQESPISNTSVTNNITTHWDIKESCPVPIDRFIEPYKSLVGYQTSIILAYTDKLGSNDTDSEPLTIRDEILQNLENIIVWGKEHKVALALHDSPYPVLMPEILKLVQKHYGSANVLAKPIILLSERDPQQWIEMRLRHNLVGQICRPSKSKDQIGTNSSSTKPIAIEMMNATTLEGGAFDIVGCMNHAAGSGNERQPQALSIKESLYTLQEAKLLKHRQFVTDAMENYQNSVRESSIFSYNPFEKENKTIPGDLAVQMKQSMIEALTNEDGQQLRMKDGLDFLGFANFFPTIERSVVEERITHRRRHHGDSYGESRYDATGTTLDEHFLSNSSSSHTKLVPVQIVRMKILCPGWKVKKD